MVYNAIAVLHASLLLRGLMIYALLLILAACSGDGSGPKDSESLSGAIVASGGVSPAGVTIRVYRAIVPDAGVAAVQADYPALAGGMRQGSLFDYRAANAVYQGSSDAAGAWSIAEMAAGVYNLVAESSSGALQIIHDITVPGGSLTISLGGNTVLQGSVAGQQLDFSNATIEVAGNTVVDETSALSFSGNNTLIFRNSSFSLTILGAIAIAPGSRLVVLSEGGSAVARLNLQGQSAGIITGLICTEPLRIQTIDADLTFEKCYLQYPGGVALKALGGSIAVVNSTLSNSLVGVEMQQVNSFTCTNSLFFQNNLDVKISQAGSSLMNNNALLNSAKNLEVTLAEMEIRNNYMLGGQENLLILPECTVDIHHNIFQDGRVNIHLEPVSHQTASMMVTAQNNNFISTQVYSIQLENATALDTVDATGSYWGTALTPDIDQLIFDRNDRPNEQSMSYVLYTPYAVSPVETAGIEAN